MKRILWLSTVTALAISGSAFAADNVTVKDATGATVTTASKDVSGVQFRKDICVTLADTAIDCFTELNASLRAEDTASADADSGLPIFAVRKATPANTSGTDGDYEALQISAGRLWTDAGALLPTSLGAKVGTGSLSVVPASDGFGVNASQTGTWNITNISGTVSLPTGAATAAKQPALGTAGSSSADVITVQGITGGTNLNVNCAAGCAGGTQYAEDAVAASGNSGTAALGVQVASPASTAADGDWTWSQYTGGKLHVIDLSANAVLGTTGDAAWASGTGTAISLLKTIANASLDTTPLSVKTDQTTHGTTDLVAADVTKIGGVAVSVGNGVSGTGVQRVTLASDSTGQVALAAGTNTIGATYGYAGTVTSTFNRPADANSYTALDWISDSTTAPTSGGFTLTGMCRISGGSGVITDVQIISNDPAALAGTVYLFDSATSVSNLDNTLESANSLSDADVAKLVGSVPFTLTARTLNASANVQNLNIGYTCSGTSNLRWLLQATGGTLTTASANTYTLRVKFIASN